ncbi:hypothetical protein K438DRAFT_1780275 [Mycena galopus ATCC 62051]|nr:hypothetical protein K438DRAFT_1780275 [Mycena galopus ATCC 62051]
MPRKKRAPLVFLKQRAASGLGQRPGMELEKRRGRWATWPHSAYRIVSNGKYACSRLGAKDEPLPSSATPRDAHSASLTPFRVRAPQQEEKVDPTLLLCTGKQCLQCSGKCGSSVLAPANIGSKQSG